MPPCDADTRVLLLLAADVSLLACSFRLQHEPSVASDCLKLSPPLHAAAALLLLLVGL
jgi:hypothetical protein